MIGSKITRQRHGPMESYKVGLKITRQSVRSKFLWGAGGWMGEGVTVKDARSGVVGVGVVKGKSCSYTMEI